MSAWALIDELTARFAGHEQVSNANPTPANPAKAAKDEHRRGLQADMQSCEGLRIVAKPAQRTMAAAPDSQEFAAPRRAPNRPENEERRGFSQDSQLSQASAWTDADIASFLVRRDRLMRWGWSEGDAEAQAERLVLRDREQDDRVTCTECTRYRPGACGQHRRADLASPDVGRDLAITLQRCPAFEERA